MKPLKRSIVFLLVWGLLIFPGCVTAKPLEQERLPKTVDQNDPGVELSAEVSSKDGQPILKVLWENNTDYSVTYGAAYDIQRQENGQWVSCAVNDPVFFTVGYMLHPGQSRKESYCPMPMFDMTKPGVYRFVTGCSVHAGEEGRISCKLRTEFTLPDELVSATLPSFQSPPGMTVTDGTASHQVRTAGFDWSCDQGDGTVSNTIADAAHPLYCRDTMERIRVTGEKGNLEFLQRPNKISIRCWPDTAWEKADIPAEAVAVSAMEFEFKTGGWIYEVTATWQKTGNAGYGEAHYYFYAEVQP